MKRSILMCLVMGILLAAAEAAMAKGPATTVTLDLPETTLAELLNKVTEQTQVRHQVDPTKGAWHLRERRLHVYVKDMPLPRLRTALGKLFGYSWKGVEAPEGYTYVLYQSEVDRAREEKARRQAIEDAEAQWVRTCKEAISIYKELYKVGPARLDASMMSGELSIGSLQQRPDIRLMTMLADDRLSRLLSGERYTVALKSFPPDVQNDVLRVVPTPMDPKQRPKDIQFTMWLDKPQPGEGFQIASNISIRCRSADGSVSGTGMRCDLAPHGEVLSSDLPRDFPVDASLLQRMNQIATRSRTAKMARLFGDQKPPKDPALLRETRLDLPGEALDPPKVMRLVADASCGQVLMDEYDPTRPPFDANWGELVTKQPLYRILNSAAADLGRRWSMEDGVLLLKDPDWAVKRSWGVPKEWVDYLKARAKEGFTFEDMVMLSGFSDEQIDHTLIAEKELAPAAQAVAGMGRPILRLFSSLSASQREQIWSTSGMRADDLSPAQHELASRAILARVPDQDPVEIIRGSTLQMVRQQGSSRDSRSQKEVPYESINLQFVKGDKTETCWLRLPTKPEKAVPKVEATKPK